MLLHLVLAEKGVGDLLNAFSLCSTVEKGLEASLDSAFASGPG